MLYQYLLDEVARKQVKVVKKGDRDDNIALQGLEHGGKQTGILENGLGAGEPAGRKSTGLRGGPEAVISRSRSERHGTKKKGKGLRRLFLGSAKDAVDFSDDSVPNTPQLPAFAAPASETEGVVKRDNRLTM